MARCGEIGWLHSRQASRGCAYIGTWVGEQLHSKFEMVVGPPWAFPQARCLYQPSWVPLDAARRVTPPEITILSAFDYTLGGTFVVEWTDSPVGPYKEVAVLSALVMRGLSLGAWVSHIRVSSESAEEYGKAFWGLPARTVRLHFEPDEDREGRGLLDFQSDGSVAVSGWDGWQPVDPSASRPRRSLLSLPSLSGCLPDERGGRTSLLRYPLQLGTPRALRLRPPLQVRHSVGVEPALRALLDGPAACPCIQIDGVDIVAGEAVVLDE